MIDNSPKLRTMLINIHETTYVLEFLEGVFVPADYKIV